MPAAVIHRVIASRGSVVPCLAACAALVVSMAMAADEEIDPTGGLRSRVPSAPEPAPTGATREELVRRWDLDGNGTIEPSEASIARARMRRARLELEQQGGIDPLTGKPRAVAGSTSSKAEEPADQPPLTTDPPPADVDTQPPPGPPGTRVPTVTGTAATRGPVPPRPPTPDQPATPRPAPIGTRPTTITGGVRAGAPAARAGYGSLVPGTTLNAGRPVPTPQPRSLPGGGRRGGLVPTMPGRGTAGRPAVPVPTRPAPPPLPPPSTPRITADEIGGY